MCHRMMDRQPDGQMNRTDFTGPLPQRWRFDHVFWKFGNMGNSENLKLFGLIVSHMERINTRKRNTINIVQCSRSSKTMILCKFT